MRNHAISDINDLIDLQRECNNRLHHAAVQLGGYPPEEQSPVPLPRTDNLDGALAALHEVMQYGIGLSHRVLDLVVGANLDAPDAPKLSAGVRAEADRIIREAR